METAVNRIPRRERMPLFEVAAREWLQTKGALAEKILVRYKGCVQNLTDHFGGRLVCDIGPQDIANYQRKRLTAGKSHRTVNYEVGTLRGILRYFGLWGQISDRVNTLPERHEVGRAVSPEDEEKLIRAAQQSRSAALLPLLALSLDSGLRASEVRALHRRDVNLVWQAGVITSGEIVVPKSKTDAGTGRTIPLTRRACAVLTMWLSRFPGANPESYMFPWHRVGVSGNERTPAISGVDLSRPMGSWKTAWNTACKKAGVKYRWHDNRHTFVSRLAENPNVSEETIRALAGHVSQRMLQRYSHIRLQAKRAAIEAVERSYSRSPAAGESEGLLAPDLVGVGTKLGTVGRP